MFEQQEQRNLRLVLVEPDRRIRRSLAGILELRSCVESVATAAVAEEAIALVATQERFDALLVDLDRHDYRLAEVARLRAACPGLPIVALTDDPGLGRRSLLAGADLFTRATAVAEDVRAALSLTSFVTN